MSRRMTAGETIDVAVIGSGFGGLTAASLAARSGFSVVLYEQHTRPGGCAGDFALEGYWFPAGATVVTGLEPGGILRRVFDATETAFQSEPLNPSIMLHTDGQVLPYENTFEGWVSTFARVFPDAPDGYERFWEWTHRTGGTVYEIGRRLPSLPIQGWADVRRSVGNARPSVVRTLPLLWKTVGDVKRAHGAVGHAAADAVIDGLLMDATGATADGCSAVQGAIALDLYRRGCQWVEGGTAKLAMSLVRSVRRDGGSVSFGVGVCALQRVGDEWELMLDTGERVRARRVVANVPPAALDRLRGRVPRLPKDDDAWGAFLLHLGIDAAGLEPMHPFHQVADASAGHSAEGANALISIYRGKGEREQQWSLSVSTHTRAGRWRGLTLEEVEWERRCLEERMIGVVEQVIPDVRSRIRLQRSALPRTFERFTGRPGGYVGGLVQRPGVVALRAPGHRPERHLYMAGDHVFPGQGTVGVALSGINAYRDVVESLGGKALL